MAEVEERESRATNDAYTGMLAISLLALLAGAALLFLDYSQYPEKDPPKVKAPVPKLEVPVEKGGGQQEAQPQKGNPPMGGVQN